MRKKEPWIVVDAYCPVCGKSSLCFCPEGVVNPVECSTCKAFTLFLHPDRWFPVVLEIENEGGSTWYRAIVADIRSPYTLTEGISGEASNLYKAFDLMIENLRHELPEEDLGV